MRTAIFILMLIHGLIHLLGFVKAFNIAPVEQLTQGISKPLGILWLAASVVFIAASVQLLSGLSFWWITGLAGIIISQALIFISWNDAKFGTIANVILLIPAVFAVLDKLPFKK